MHTPSTSPILSRASVQTGPRHEPPKRRHGRRDRTEGVSEPANVTRSALIVWGVAVGAYMFFGALGLTQGIGLAAARYNINVNGICPGIIDTRIGEKQGGTLSQQMAKYSGKPEEQMKENIRKSIPLRRFQTAEDIGYMALFLCSELAKNITCQAINVCGGMRMN